MNAKTVLVVEDNPITRKLLRVSLRTEGYRVLEAPDGATALSILEREWPDLILQDLMLPDIDGVQLAQKIRSLPNGATLPIIAVSGFISRLEEAKRRQIGFTDVLAKPVEPSVLLEVVRGYLKGKEQPAGGSRRVLVVDDNPTQRKLLALLLEEMGFTVTQASDGMEALEEIRLSPPDAVVSDVLMPRMDGFQLCSTLKADERFIKIPVILVSSVYTGEEDRCLAEALGAARLLIRSGGASDLAPLLREALAGEANPEKAAGPRPTFPSPNLMPQLQHLTDETLRQSRGMSMLETGLGILSNLPDVVGEKASTEELLQDLLPRCIHAVGLSRGAAYLADDRGKLRLAAHQGYDAEGERGLTELLGVPARFEEAFRRREPIRITKETGSPEDAALLDRAQASSLILSPMRVGNEGVGLLLIDSDTPEMSEHWKLLAGAWGSHLGKIIGLARALARASSSERRYGELMEHARDGVLILSIDGKFLEVNRRTEELFGYTRRELQGRSYSDICVPEDLDRADGLFQEMVKTGSILAPGIRIRRKDGRILEADFSASIVETPSRVVLAIAHDVTKRNEAERRRHTLHQATRALAEAKNLDAALSGVLEAMSEHLKWSEGALWLQNASGDALHVAGYRRKSGRDAGALESDSRAMSLRKGEGLPGRIWASGNPQWISDACSESFCRSNAAKRDGIQSCLGIPIVHGPHLMGVLELFHREPVDVDDELIQMVTSLGRQFGQYVERIRTEEALVESEQRFRQFAENTQAVFWISSVDQKEMLYINPAYEAVFGRSCKELYETPQSWLRAIHPDDRAQVGSLASASPARPYEVTYRIQRPDGMIRWIHARGFPIRNTEGRVCRLAGIAMDMTDLHRSQEMLQTSENQLRQAQKMEAVGRLAGGVAHDFNNLLTVINGYSQLSLGTLNGDHPLHASLEEILKAGVRASTLTRQLLAFSRKQVIQPKVVELNEIVGGTEKMLTRLIGEDIALRADLAKDAGVILADPGQVEQVILNLAVNARDAMPGGGHLTISTAAVTIDEEYAATHQGVQSGPYVQLSVTDTGTGMNDEVKSHLFEPFFTTKEQGKGTGLGLSTVFGIVKQSNGHIGVYSELGKGTCFKILFPQVSGDCSKTAAPSRVAVPRGKETLLIVEDQAEVRMYLAILLRDYGYKVLEARDGREALKISSDYADPIHLVLTDVVMPHVGGPGLAASLRDARPEILIVFMSGYAEGALGHQGILDAGVNFIEKPFMPNLLMAKIRSVLDEAKTVSA